MEKDSIFENPIESKYNKLMTLYKLIGKKNRICVLDTHVWYETEEYRVQKQGKCWYKKCVKVTSLQWRLREKRKIFFENPVD